MPFLVDADLPRNSAALIRAFGHEATDVRDINMGAADDPIVAARAKSARWSLMTGDFGFADVRNYPPSDFYGIVVLEIPNHAGAAFILELIQGFMTQLPSIGELSGKLVIVAPGRIRIRITE